MRTFSKFVLLLNCCFLLQPFFYYTKLYIGDGEVPRPLDAIRGSIVVLAQVAIMVNILFLLIVFIRAALKMELKMSKVILIFNIAVFLFQVYFYFFSK
jgi:hypothetical protein